MNGEPVPESLARETVRTLEGLAAIAARMLPRMMLAGEDSRGLFCFKVKADGEGRLTQVGFSLRQTLIAWIGMFAAAGTGLAASGNWKAAQAELNRRLAARPDEFSIAELGMVVWLSEWVDGLRAEEAVKELLRRWPSGRRHVDTMDASILLTGLLRGRARLSARGKALVPASLQHVLSAWRRSAGLFAISGSRLRALAAGRGERAVLGSYASQVYPVLALSTYLESESDPSVREALFACAGAVCRLQGENGEWWWIYDTRDGGIVLDFPVYSVHQDGMGPMALLSAYRVEPRPEFIAAVQRGARFVLDWRHAGTGERLLDEEEPMIWRAVVRDLPGDPADAPFGVSPGELEWMKSAARSFRRVRTSRFSASGYRVLREARPYCPGWILFGYAVACRVLGNPAQVAVPM